MMKRWEHLYSLRTTLIATNMKKSKADFIQSWMEFKRAANTSVYMEGTRDFINSRLARYGVTKLANGAIDKAYRKYNIIQSPSKGIWRVNICLIKEDILNLCWEEARTYRARWQKPTTVVVESKLNSISFEEECIQYLREKGYFVYLPQKGDNIQITKVFNF